MTGKTCITWLRIALIGCSLAAASAVQAAARDENSGHPEPAKADPPPALNPSPPDYLDSIQPIFNRRCIACHGCLGSPCNVKLDSYRGVRRGGFGVNPYAGRLEPGPRTDMDAAHSLAKWRDIGFYPVVPVCDSTDSQQIADHREDSPAALGDSLLYQMIAAGRAANVGEFSRHALDGFRQQRFTATCPSSPQALAQRLQEFPQVGMPYGLTALSDQEFATLRDWIAAGAPGPSKQAAEQARVVANLHAVAAWEAFFNQPDKRHALVSRFIFDHVFLATIVLEESPGDRFRLVRSKTPPMPLEDAPDGPGLPPELDLIGTGLPYQNPYTYADVDHYWYRLEKITAPPVQKNLFLWRLSLATLEQLESLFFAEPWPDGGELDPPWDLGNPFRVFAAIPAEARYRFLLEYADVIVGSITYGPVCNGQTATYAVKDQFWVFFLDPKQDPSVQDPMMGLETWDVFMDRSAFANASYRKAYAKAQARLSPEGWSLDAIWNGGGENPNAWLTVLRHETNVSMLQGAQGGLPRTFWLMDYSGLERIYYDTVANFEYWSGDPSKLETLLFFNFLRQEFEDNFLLLLPPDVRRGIRHQWTQGIGSIGLLLVPFAGADQPSDIDLNGKNPLLGLLDQIAKRMGPKISRLPDRLNPRLAPANAADGAKVAPRPIKTSADWESAVARLTARRGEPFMSLLPSVTVVRLNEHTEGSAQAGQARPEVSRRVYSLIANRAYKSQYTMVFQNGQALPAENTISVYPGLVNGFPNLFVDLELDQARVFLDELQALESTADWEAFIGRWAILRNDPNFWSFYDWLNHWNMTGRGQAAGWLDLTYYDAPEI